MDDRVPEHRDSHGSSSHESSLELLAARSADLGKHSVYTHFPKDRNCEICQKTKITRAPCRRRIGGAVPCAGNLDGLITADHKVLSEGCESRNNLRYAVVVQDLATQWIQSYPCETKTSEETQKILQKFLEANRKPKVIYTDNSLEFGKACEDLSWNHCTSTPLRSEYYLVSAKDESRIHQFGKKVSLGLFLGYALYARWNLEGWHNGCRPWGFGDDGRIGNLLEKTECERGDISQRKRTIFPVADGRIKFTIGGDLELRTSTLIRKHPIRGEGQRDFLGESEVSLPPPQDSFPDAGEAINDFWSMSGNFICRHHVEPRVKLDSPREESFLVPLKYIWHLQNYTYEFRCQAREAHRWLLEYWWLSKLVWSFDRFHTIYSIGRKSFQTDICGPRRD